MGGFYFCGVEGRGWVEWLVLGIELVFRDVCYISVVFVVIVRFVEGLEKGDE